MNRVMKEAEAVDGFDDGTGDGGVVPCKAAGSGGLRAVMTEERHEDGERRGGMNKQEMRSSRFSRKTNAPARES